MLLATDVCARLSFVQISQCLWHALNTVIRDCGSNLYVGMRVVEMF